MRSMDVTRFGEVGYVFGIVWHTGFNLDGTYREEREPPTVGSIIELVGNGTALTDRQGRCIRVEGDAKHWEADVEIVKVGTDA